MSKDKTGSIEASNSACPNCGYCPHCGRRDAAPARPYPYPVNPLPWVYPRYVPGPIWITSSPTTVTAAPPPTYGTFNANSGSYC